MPEAVRVAEQLPFPVDSMAAAWTGTHTFLFGGDTTGSDGKRVLRHDPAAHAVDTRGAALPSHRSYFHAFWDGTFVYTLGGMQWGQPIVYLDEVLRYDPAADTLEVRLHHEAIARAGYGFFWDGTSAYLLGGSGSAADCVPQGPGGLPVCDGIVRYTPLTNTVEVLPEKLPERMRGMAAAWDGSSAAYLFGKDGYSDVILRYEPADHRVSQMSARLPLARAWANAAWAGDFGYVLTGAAQGQPQYPVAIVRYNATAGPPSLAAYPAHHHVDLEWADPPDTTYTDPLTGFRIFRGTAPGGEAFLTDVGLVHVYADYAVQYLPPVTYYYKVAALNARGQGNMSNEAVAAPLP